MRTLTKIPPLDLKFAARLASKIIGVTPEIVLAGLNNFPEENVIQHWIWTGAGASAGRQFLEHEGLQSASRLIYAVIAGEAVPETYRVAQVCALPNCVHPSCYTLKTFRMSRYGYLQSLPPRLARGKQGAAQDIHDLLEEFATLEKPTLESVLETYGQAFPPSSIRDAIKRFHDGERAGRL